MTVYTQLLKTNDNDGLIPKPSEEGNAVPPQVPSGRKRSLIIVSLFIFLFGCCVLEGGQFLGLWPRYPGSQSYQVCGSPGVYTVGSSDYWHLSIGTCFKTTDSAEQVYLWYEAIGWSGSPLDRFGQTISFNAGIGRFINVSTKRHVLVFDTNVMVNTKHELYVLPCIPTPMEAQSWEGVKIFAAIPAFVKICLH